MSKLKIEKGASKIRRTPLKVTINGTVADDLELMCQWSENDLSYLVNALLEYALGQSEEFQRYKADRVESGAVAVSASPKRATEPSKADAIPASRL